MGARRNPIYDGSSYTTITRRGGHGKPTASHRENLRPQGQCSCAGSIHRSAHSYLACKRSTNAARVVDRRSGSRAHHAAARSNFRAHDFRFRARHSAAVNQPDPSTGGLSGFAISVSAFLGLRSLELRVPLRTQHPQLPNPGLRDVFAPLRNSTRSDLQQLGERRGTARQLDCLLSLHAIEFSTLKLCPQVC